MSNLTVRKFPRLIWSATVFAWCFSLITTPALAQNGLEATVREISNGGSAFTQSATNPDALPSRVGELIGLVLAWVGVIFFALVIYGGLQWMTAQGNDAKVGKAKEIIINATIGLVIVLSAYAITMFVGDNLTN